LLLSRRSSAYHLGYMRYQFALLIVLISSFAFAESPTASSPTWKKLTLSDKFYCEGANFADFNKDGKIDVVSGPWWYEGPDFTKKHEIYKPTGNQEGGSYKADNDYSDNFFAFTYDFNNDGYPDVLVYGFPGKEARVYLNPGKDKIDQHWEMKLVFDQVDNESPQFADLTGDGKPDGVFHSKETMGYATIDWKDPLKQWTYHPISPKGGCQLFTHGYGVADLNGDALKDIVSGKRWMAHGSHGDAEPMAAPVLYWFELKRTGGKVEWIGHQIDDNSGVGTQVVAGDINGDKTPDIVVGNKKGTFVFLSQPPVTKTASAK